MNDDIIQMYAFVYTENVTDRLQNMKVFVRRLLEDAHSGKLQWPPEWRHVV